MLSWNVASKQGISRADWIRTVSKPRNVTGPKYRGREIYSCCHRGEVVDSIDCKTCGRTQPVDVYSCRRHGSCTVTKLTKYAMCQICEDRRKTSKEVYFEDYMDAYTGECYVFGSGETGFDYKLIPDLTEPLFFINQAAQLAVNNHWSDKFMMSLDKKHHIFFPVFEGTLLLPANQNMDDAKGLSPGSFINADQICWWSNKLARTGHLETEKEELQRHKILHQGTSGCAATIFPMVHFLWYAGFDKVNLVGCDGKPGGYDPRLKNFTQQNHDMNGLPNGGPERFAKFREYQDNLANELELEVQYL